MVRHKDFIFAAGTAVWFLFLDTNLSITFNRTILRAPSRTLVQTIYVQEVHMESKYFHKMKT